MWQSAPGQAISQTTQPNSHPSRNSLVLSGFRASRGRKSLTHSRSLLPSCTECLASFPSPAPPTASGAFLFSALKDRVPGIFALHCVLGMGPLTIRHRSVGDLLFLSVSRSDFRGRLAIPSTLVAKIDKTATAKTNLPEFAMNRFDPMITPDKNRICVAAYCRSVVESIAFRRISFSSTLMLLYVTEGLTTINQHASPIFERTASMRRINGAFMYEFRRI